MSPRPFKDRFKASLLAAGTAATVSACQEPDFSNAVFDPTASQAKTELLQNIPAQNQVSKSARVKQIGEVYLDRLSAVGIEEKTAKTIAIQQALATVKHLEREGQGVSYRAFTNLQTSPELANTLASIEQRFIPEANRLTQHTTEYFGNPNREEAQTKRQAWTARDIAGGWEAHPAPEANFEQDTFNKYFPTEPLRAPEIPTSAPETGQAPISQTIETNEPARSFPWRNALKITGVLALGGTLLAARKKITGGWKAFWNKQKSTEKNGISSKEQTKLKSRANYLRKEILKDRNQEFSVFLAERFPGFDPLKEILSIEQAIAVKDSRAVEALNGLVSRYNEAYQTYTREWMPTRLAKSQEVTKDTKPNPTTQTQIFEPLPEDTLTSAAPVLSHQFDFEPDLESTSTTPQPLPQITPSQAPDVSYLSSQASDETEIDQAPTNPWEGPLVTIPQADNGEGKSYQIPEIFQDRVPDPNKVQESRKWLADTTPLVSEIHLYKGREILPNNKTLQDKKWRETLAQAEVMYRGDLDADFKQLLSDLILTEMVYIDPKKLPLLVDGLKKYQAELKQKALEEYIKGEQADLPTMPKNSMRYQILQSKIAESKERPKYNQNTASILREGMINFLEQEVKYIPNGKNFKMVGDIINDDKGSLKDDGLTLRLLRSLRQQAEEMKMKDPFTIVASNHDLFVLTTGPKIQSKVYECKSKSNAIYFNDAELETLYHDYLTQTTLFDYNLETDTLMSHVMLVDLPDEPNARPDKLGAHAAMQIMLTHFNYPSIQTKAELADFVEQANTWYRQTILELIDLQTNDSKTTSKQLRKKVRLLHRLVQSRKETQNYKDLFFHNIVRQYVVGHAIGFGSRTSWELTQSNYNPIQPVTLVNLNKIDTREGIYISK